ncbi:MULTISPECIES: hypothetical protein [Exiguobacterium]|uniref:hypothetical protein n=1 Tax=Exiguobacterium TaxID=33986 RepID=UPI001BECD697|nr:MULTISPECIES: hypothetical protein [Exiguobacterium]MCT4792788.1 hypothetical protein [Exiguobacterium artemiae]
MELCSLCGTPLKTDATSCSYCKHPVLKKIQVTDSSISTKPAQRLFSCLFFLVIALTSAGLWYGLTQTDSTHTTLAPPVQASPTADWSDETSAYNQTYSSENPPASYDVLKFVRQYTKTVPETATYSKTTDTLETFSAIQFATLETFHSEVAALRTIQAASDSPIPPRLYTVDFERFVSKGASFQIKTVETYQLTRSAGQHFVTYDVRYNVRLHTDHLQITHIVRTEVKA